VQEKETINQSELEDLSLVPAEGRILAVDPGTKRIGVAVTDAERIVCTPLPVIERSSWKRLVLQIEAILNEFDAKAIVIGLPLESDGSENEMSAAAREMARKLRLTFDIPVFLQDERVTSYAAKSKLWAENRQKDLRGIVDSEAAAIFLSDFVDRASSGRS
jgi:putative Holliday junction resolvase